jgi:hypothetical protein
MDEWTGMFDIGDRIEVVNTSSIFIVPDTCLSMGGTLPVVVFETSLSVVSSNTEKCQKNKNRIVWKINLHLHSMTKLFQ